jgi:hypothetical protein
VALRTKTGKQAKQSRPGGRKAIKAETKLSVGTKNDRALKKTAKAASRVPTNVDVTTLIRNTVKPSKTISAPKLRVKPIAPQKATAAQKNKVAPKKTLAKKTRGVRGEHVASEIAQAMMGEMAAYGEDSVLSRQAARSQRERDLLARLAVSMSRVDEMPNLELAADIVVTDDVEAVGLLVGVIERHDDTHAPDAARVLCEVGTRAPELLEKHAERLIAMCEDSQRDMLANTMFALSPVAPRYVDALWDLRDLFWSALADLTQPADPSINLAQAGAVRLLSSLCSAGPDYARTLAGGLVDLLGKCLPKDVAFFAESVLPALGTAHSHRAKPVLDRRMKELTPAEVARLRRAVRAAQTGQPLFAAA